MKYFNLNQTVYHPIYGEGKVININNKVTVSFKCHFTNIFFTLDGKKDVNEPITLSQNPIPKIINKPLEVKYIPFTFEDRELLRGRYVKNKYVEEEILINYISKNKVGLDSSYYSYEDLLNDYEFVDGKPCGKQKIIYDPIENKENCDLNNDVYETVGKENDKFVVKGKFKTQKEALDLANKLNSENLGNYYDWRKS